MAIYTKKGDKGETKVFDKKTGQLIPVSKKSCKIKAIGSIDELNSFLGIVISEMRKELSNNKNRNKYVKLVHEVQGNLFVINSILAGSNLKFSKTQVKKLETAIDEWEGTLPVLKNFIFYGGSQTSSSLFYARALCRRAERSLVLFYKKYPYTDQQILTYFNRLSDYLFMFARKINFLQEIKEEFWVGNKK